MTAGLSPKLAAAFLANGNGKGFFRLSDGFVAVPAGARLKGLYYLGLIREGERARDRLGGRLWRRLGGLGGGR